MVEKFVPLEISIPFWLDALIIGAINSNSETIQKGADFGVSALDDGLEGFVQKTTFTFDNKAKEEVTSAITMAFVKKYKPELLPG